MSFKSLNVSSDLTAMTHRHDSHLIFNSKTLTLSRSRTLGFFRLPLERWLANCQRHSESRLPWIISSLYKLTMIHLCREIKKAWKSLSRSKIALVSGPNKIWTSSASIWKRRRRTLWMRNSILRFCLRVTPASLHIATKQCLNLRNRRSEAITDQTLRSWVSWLKRMQL